MPSDEVDKKDLIDNKAIPSSKESSNASLEEEKKCFSTVVSCEVVPRTIVGPAHSYNKGAVEWGHHDLLAYGCSNTVAVLDTKNVQLVQILDGHKAIVKKVLWVNGTEPNADGSGRLQLLSGDLSGQIIHWDVTDGLPLAVLQDGNKPVIGMAWVPGHEKELILASVHSPYFLIVWSVKKEAKLWKKSFTDTLLSFDFDPFSQSKLAFLCTDCILLVEEFQLHKIPSTNGRKFYVSAGSQFNREQESVRSGQRDRLKRLIRTINIDENKPKSDDGMTVNECLQLIYHRSLRDHLILLYPRDVLIIDVNINQTLTILPLDKSTSPVIQVWTCRRRDVLFLLHESGSVAVKVRKRCKGSTESPSPPLPQQDSSPPHQSAEYSWFWSDITGYEGKCQSDIVRQSKSSKVLSLAVDPINETNIGMTLTCGKVILLDLHRINPKLQATLPVSITEVFPGILPLENISCRLSIVGAIGRLSGNVTIARMSPHSRGHNTPLLSVGTSTGFLYLIHLGLGTVLREFAVHSHPIRGIEWADVNRVFTYSYTSASANGKVKNELHLTDIRNGRTTPTRVDRPQENPIHLIRVSPLSQYFVVIIENGPFELWEITPQIGLVRTAPKKFPYIVALEWSPIRKRKMSTNETTGKAGKGKTKENLLFSDTACQLHLFSVQEDNFTRVLTIPQDLGDVTVTCLAFKANQIVQGDSQGTLNMWDMTESASRQESAGRSAIRYLRFAPGRANLRLLVLFSDGSIRIVNLHHSPPSEGHRSPGKLLSGIVSGTLPEESWIEKVSELKPGGTIGKIVDADWASADFPVIVTEDGTVRVMDIDLKRAASSISQYSMPDTLSCPQGLGEGTLNKVQFLLATQYWKEQPSVDDFQVIDGFTNTELTNVNKELAILGLHKQAFLSLKTVDKCLLTAKLFGMPQAVDLWTIASYYIRVASLRKDNADDPATETSRKISDVEPLNTCYDYLMDSHSYRVGENERCHEWKRGDHRQRQALIDRLLLLGEMDRGVHLLLDTDFDNPNYYTDAIKACLVATIQQFGAAQSTIKLVATNLIANARIWQGVELLCLMGKGIDGCRYLAASGLWESAVWLAKATLSPSETLLIMKRYADHLLQNGDKFRAMLVMLSECEFDRALEILLTQGDVFTAALLVFACRDYAIPISSEILDRIFTRLKDYMVTIGNEEAAKYAAEQVGKS